jgi:hypothetical protein
MVIILDEFSRPEISYSMGNFFAYGESRMKYLLIDNHIKDIDYPKIGKISKIVKFYIDKKEPILACILHESKQIEVGDMIYFRDELISDGFILWKDFTIKKLNE